MTKTTAADRAYSEGAQAALTGDTSGLGWYFNPRLRAAWEAGYTDALNTDAV